MSDQSSGSRARPLPAPTPVHDVITGGLEGGLGVLALEPALQKLRGVAVENPFRPGVLGRIGSAGAIGAASTGLIGALVSMGQRKRAQKKPDEMERVLDLVVEFKKIYVIDDEDTDNPTIHKTPFKSKTAAAVQGGLAGGGIGTAAGIGAGFVAPAIAKRFGAQKVIKSWEQALGGRASARLKTGLALAGAGGKVGATIGTVAAVSHYNQAVRRSKAIADAIKNARKDKEKEMSAKSAEQKVIEFSYDEPFYDPALRSGVRVDRYKKQIEAREIDRRTSNYVRGGALGAISGVALPVAGSLKHRAILGAAAGLGVATAVDLNSPTDRYGEQSEGSKIVQRRVIQGSAASTLIAAALMRKKKLGGVFKTMKGVVGRMTAPVAHVNPHGAP